ncbi:hypothetical protein VHUM_03124 [Vanrija humicola]|uniref:Uncharacterized protein n=1 Tax=Vanrija humicola TaxID=5417 RepID=A0A7D8Z2B4_VANHU|nr:hypothetical protein VHUM_03124 [Vanrija humicola]
MVSQASVSGKAEEVDADDSRASAPTPDQLPTDAELRLTRRVLDLERERDALAVSRILDASTRIPVPAAGAEPDAQEPQPIVIPHDLIPVLALLRQHIAELTRDNMALRYTFLGPSSSRLDAVSPASSMATTPLPATSPLPSVAGMSPMPLAAFASPPAPTIEITEAGPASPGVDLAAVVDRVRVLTLENEELGQMVAEAGRADASEWLKTLEDSKAVIASLE